MRNQIWCNLGLYFCVAAITSTGHQLPPLSPGPRCCPAGHGRAELISLGLDVPRVSPRLVFYFNFFFSFFFLFVFLGLRLPHMEVPRPGVKLELQPLVYAIAIAVQDLNCIFDPHHSSWQHWILNSPSKTRDGTLILMDPSRVH